MTEESIGDKENKELNNSRDARLRPPTSLKRPSSVFNDPQESKKPKIPNPMEKPVNISLQQDSSIGGRTFMMPARTTKIGTTNPPLQKSIRLTKPTQDSSISRRPVNTTLPPRGENIFKLVTPQVKRPAWDIKGKLADMEIAFKEKTEELNNKIKELETEKSQIQSEQEETLKQKTEFVEKNERLTIEINELNETNESLKQDLKNSQLENFKLNEKIKEKEIDNLDLKNKCIEMENRITKLNEQLVKNKYELEETNYTLSQTRNRLQNLQDEVNDKEAQLSNLNKNINDRKVEIIELMNKYDASLKKINNIDEELEKANESNKNLNQTNELLNSKLENKQKELVSLQDEHKKLISERDNLTYNYGSEQQRVCEMLKENKQLKEKTQQDSETIVRLNSRINELLKNCDSLTANLGQYGTRVNSLQSQMEGYKKQIALSDVERRAMHHKIMELRGTIRVCCRVRPTISKEDPKNTCVIEYRNYENSLTISSSKERETVTGSKADATRHDFTFDAIFGPNSTQFQVFTEIEPLIQSVLDGYSVCIFAYGQTGSGKTYTMEGDPYDSERTGMIERTVEKIFGSMGTMLEKGWKYDVECHFLEIYNDNIHDLLVNDPKNATEKLKLDIKQKSTCPKTDKTKKIPSNKSNEIHIPNLTIVKVSQTSQVKNLLSIANRNRSVASTKCNEMSSRSHSVFSLKLSGFNDFLNEKIEAFINLVDLAGSERLDQSGVEGERLKETQFINKSLSALKNVIGALCNKDSHVPFRDSKLTQLLRPSLGGNCKTLMFVNISPMEESYRESLNSLRFATNVNECYIGNATQNKTSSKDSG